MEIALGQFQANVLLIMTNEQGYGDVGGHGNDIINTPNMDALAWPGRGQSLSIFM